MNKLLGGLCVCSVLLCAASSQAAIWKFDVFLDGLQESPPVATPGTGTALALLDDSTGMMNITGTFSDLIGTSNNAHLHGYAPVGDPPAGVIFGLTFDFGVTSGNFSGSGSVDVAQALDGLSYINVHSTFRPGGEIRGQLVNPMRVPEPASLTLAGVGLLLALAARRRR
jgi:hypothetical protein